MLALFFSEPIERQQGMGQLGVEVALQQQALVMAGLGVSADSPRI